MKAGAMELIVVFAIVVVLFGPTQIPKLTRMFGKSVKSFKEGMGAEDESAEKKESKSPDAEE